MLHTRNATHTTHHQYVPRPPPIRRWQPSLHAQIVKWVFMCIICACLICPRLGAPSTRIPNTANIILNLLHIRLCKQVWVLPFVHANKIIGTQIEVSEHLEKVHRYNGEIAPYEWTTGIIPFSKYSSFKIQVYLRDIYIFCLPDVDNLFCIN